MDQTTDKIARAHALLTQALSLLDEREYLVEAAFVQTALDRVTETLAAFTPTPDGDGDNVVPLRKL
ncbi:hypothetical protein HT136_06375 [Novosphingobium profundi]|uniref:hypothetical protein n=1 Tax=Novosphingobium profundi TaxID=1774954 RepID=UPI001BD956F0|nr:hypothetical protein [Novosphingobium profundi]MBT0667991.1 hypothetical protein [Novosphingobium profundi]